MEGRTKLSVTVCQILDEVMGQYCEDCPSDEHKLAQLTHSLTGWSPKYTHGDKCKMYKVIPKPIFFGQPKKAIVKYNGLTAFAQNFNLHQQPIIVDFEHSPFIFVEVYSKFHLKDGEKVGDLIKERLNSEVPNLEVMVQEKY